MKNFTGILISAVLLLAFNENIQACSCAYMEDELHFDNAAYVFTAKIKKPLDIKQGTYYIVRSEFDPITVFKGDISNLSHIYSSSLKGNLRTSCDWVLKTNETYLFFISDQHKPHPHYCSGSRSVKPNDDILKKLQQLSPDPE